MFIAMSPVMLWFFLSFVYEKIIRYLRRDPKVDFPKLARDKVEHTQSLENAIAHLEYLAETMAKKGNASVGDLIELTIEPETDYDRQLYGKCISYEKMLSSEYVDITLKLRLVEYATHEGEVAYASLEDDENPELASEIIANVGIKNYPSKDAFNVRVNFDEMGAYFCIGALQGGGWYNESVGQLWSYLKDQNVWMVRYSSDGKDFGLRKNKIQTKARRLWFDSKSN
jgi:hypothetical protein